MKLYQPLTTHHGQTHLLLRERHQYGMLTRLTFHYAHTDRFNLPSLSHAAGLQQLVVYTAAPVCFKNSVFSQITSHFMPETRKVTGFNHQHQITFCQQIHQRGFPGPCARGRIYHNMTFCLKIVFIPARQAAPILAKSARGGQLWDSPWRAGCGQAHYLAQVSAENVYPLYKVN